MRQKILFNDYWLFHEGDIEEEFPALKGPMYSQAKTAHRIYGPAAQHYNARYDDYSTSGLTCTERWMPVKIAA